MKLDIHPDYKEGTVTCSCGYSFKVFSTMGLKSGRLRLGCQFWVANFELPIRGDFYITPVALSHI